MYGFQQVYRKSGGGWYQRSNVNSRRYRLQCGTRTWRQLAVLHWQETSQEAPGHYVRGTGTLKSDQDGKTRSQGVMYAEQQTGRRILNLERNFRFTHSTFITCLIYARTLQDVSDKEMGVWWGRRGGPSTTSALSKLTRSSGRQTTNKPRVRSSAEAVWDGKPAD